MNLTRRYNGQRKLKILMNGIDEEKEISIGDSQGIFLIKVMDCDAYSEEEINQYHKHFCDTINNCKDKYMSVVVPEGIVIEYIKL